MAKISLFKVASGKGDPPFDPYVQLSLSRHSEDSAGRTLLGSRLSSEMEIDELVDFLIAQLENARKKAKEELQKVKG